MYLLASGFHAYLFLMSLLFLFVLLYLPVFVYSMCAYSVSCIINSSSRVTTVLPVINTGACYSPFNFNDIGTLTAPFVWYPYSAAGERPN